MKEIKSKTNISEGRIKIDKTYKTKEEAEKSLKALDTVIKVARSDWDKLSKTISEKDGQWTVSLLVENDEYKSKNNILG